MPHEPRSLTPRRVIVVAVGCALVILLITALAGVVQPTTRTAATTSALDLAAAVVADVDGTSGDTGAGTSEASSIAFLEMPTNRMVRSDAAAVASAVDVADPIATDRGGRATATVPGPATVEARSHTVPVVLAEPAVTHPSAVPPASVPPLRPAAASATQPVNSRGPAAVLDQIPATATNWIATNGWTLEWRQGPGPGRVAEAQYHTKTIVVWYDTNRPDHIWAGAIAHELGHAISHHHLSPAQKAEWTSMRGLATWAWQPGMANDFAVGEGDFAEAFMHHLLGHPIRSDGGPLTPTQRDWIATHTPLS